MAGLATIESLFMGADRSPSLESGRKFTRRQFIGGLAGAGVTAATGGGLLRPHGARAETPADRTNEEIIANLTLFTSEQTDRRPGVVAYETVVSRKWGHTEGIGPEGVYEDVFTTDLQVADPDFFGRIYAPNVAAGTSLEAYTLTVAERLKVRQALKWNLDQLPEISNMETDFKMDGCPTREVVTPVASVAATKIAARVYVGRHTQLPDGRIVSFEGEFTLDREKRDEHFGPFDDMCRLVDFLDVDPQSV